MKIASVRADVYSHRFDGVAVTQGVGQMVKRDLVLVRVTAEDGTVGYGEAHHGLNPTAVAEVINHSMAPLVVGADVLAMEDVWERISRHQIVTHGLGAGSVIALSGIDTLFGICVVSCCAPPYSACLAERGARSAPMPVAWGWAGSRIRSWNAKWGG
jgi:hypothetical protein